MISGGRNLQNETQLVYVVTDGVILRENACFFLELSNVENSFLLYAFID